MANYETLEKAYGAIGALRAKGQSRIDVGLVASTAGIARSTFYLDDEDWKEVRAVIAGKPSERVKLRRAEVEEKSLADQRIEAFAVRLAEAEEEVVRIQDTAGKVYRELIDEVQRWFVKASESPAKKNQMARALRELNSNRKEVERLRSENQVLQAQVDGLGTIQPLVRKEIITLDVSEPLGQVFTSFLQQLDALPSQKNKRSGVVATYLMCGLPLAGKSHWIEAHQPTSPGIHIYVDSCAHSADMRRFIADRIHYITKSEVHCVWVRTGLHTCLGRVMLAGDERKENAKQRQIEKVASCFEAPRFDESFDSIILLKECE